MEQITNYFEHMDYVSFGVVALPCVVIAVYGFLQVASGLSKCKNDKMQRCNQNRDNSNINTTSNSNSSGNKRCPQKYTGNNLAATNGMMGYQQHATAAAATLQHGGNTGNKHTTRKSRYNSNRQHQQQQHQQQQSNAFGNIQKRNGNTGITGSESSPSPPPSDWLERSYGHRLANSSCIEDKFLGQHNPGHRNSTSSEATSEDIDSSREHLNKAKGNSSGGNGGGNSNVAGVPCGNKSRSKRQQKQQRNPEQNGQKPGATASIGGQKTKQTGGKWRQQQQQPNPNSNSNSPQQQQQQKRGSNKKPVKCSSINSSNIGNPGSNISKHGSNTQRKSCDSSSSSALSSPTSSPTSSPLASGNRKRIERSLMPGAALEWRRERERGRQNANFLVPQLRQYEQLDLDHRAVVQRLQRHVIDHHLLRVYGFPVESVVHEGAIEIFKCLPHMSFAAALAETAPAVTVINCHDGLSNQRSEEEVATSSDSGNSSPRSLDSESGGEWSGSECESSNSSSSSSSSGEAELSLELKYCQYVEVERSLAKPCARCKRHFLVDELTGQYLTREECHYHSGKYQRYYDGVCHGRWTCCHEGEESSPGCCLGDRHVWTGSVAGVNGPYYDFVRTQHRICAEDEEPAVYALDCEMSYTGRGLDVTKVSLVALNGQLVYEHFVRPECDIIDYNTRYSGITERDLRSGAKSLAEVQRDLLELIAADTILIGHGLDNDLRALRLVHNTLIDTSISFPHSSGFPYRKALRHLTKVHLKREIQSGDGTTGHSSFEDSRACMELMLWRINRELDPTWSWED